MILPNNPEDGSAVEIPFPVSTSDPVLKFRPVANHLILQYQRPSKVGEIIMPVNQKPLDTIVCTVLAAGPDCKQVKTGERVLILTKALVGGPNGLLVEGQAVYVTQEQVVIAVVE